MQFLLYGRPALTKKTKVDWTYALYSQNNNYYDTQVTWNKSNIAHCFWDVVSAPTHDFIACDSTVL